MKTEESESIKHTFCRLCEVMCGLAVTVTDGAITAVRADRDHPVSAGFVCNKGLRTLDIHRDPDRLAHPIRRSLLLSRTGGAGARQTNRVATGWERVSWPDAVADVAARLRAVIDRHGPESVAVYIGNPNAFNCLSGPAAALFLLSLGSTRIFSAATQDCANKFAVSEILYGSPDIHPVADLERTPARRRARRARASSRRASAGARSRCGLGSPGSARLLPGPDALARHRQPRPIRRNLERARAAGPLPATGGPGPESLEDTPWGRVRRSKGSLPAALLPNWIRHAELTCTSSAVADLGLVLALGVGLDQGFGQLDAGGGSRPAPAHHPPHPQHPQLRAGQRHQAEGPRDRSEPRVDAPRRRRYPGLSQGDVARVQNEVGALDTSVALDPNLLRGVVAMTHGFGHAGSLGMPTALAHPGVNVNVLSPSGPGSFEPLSGVTHLTGIPVDVRRVGTA